MNYRVFVDLDGVLADFVVSDALSSGYRFRVLNIVDDFTKECISQLVAPHSSIGYIPPAEFAAKYQVA